jgi:hypothetical protein
VRYEQKEGIMKNLIYKIRDGHTAPLFTSEEIGCKYQKTISYDVFTELWEFDNKEDYLEILNLICNEDQEVVYQSIYDIDTYAIIDTDEINNAVKDMINNDEVYEDLLDTDFFINLSAEIKYTLINN